MSKLKYLTEVGLQNIRGATERAYARPSVSVNLPVATMLALLAEIDRLIEVEILPAAPLIDNEKIEQAILYLNTYGFGGYRLMTQELLAWQDGADPYTGKPVSEDVIRFILKLVDIDGRARNTIGWRAIRGVDSPNEE